MKNNLHIIPWLLPLSYIYKVGVDFRNYLFDRKVLKSETFRLPVICVGNLTVGGTGKTPHTEYLIRLLHRQWRVAVLSRGYKRKSRGLVVAGTGTPFSEIGDEPYQMKQKFPDITLAVCKKREVGIRALTQQPQAKAPQVIILDDAFQYRRVEAGINILLTDFHRLICQDKLLPAGRLREPFENRIRANIIIVTKCPARLTPLDYSLIEKKLELCPFQNLFFTTQQYKNLKEVFGKKSLPLQTLKTVSNILMLTGIATPNILAHALRKWNRNVTKLSFGDHHDFTPSDERKINSTYQRIRNNNSIIVTTEKDAARLRFCQHLSGEVQNALYSLPVEVAFLKDDAENFNSIILNYVRTNQ